MCRLLLLILTVLSGLQAYQEAIRLSKEDLEIGQLGEVIKNVVTNRCLKNANEDAFKELKQEALNFRPCMSVSESLKLPNITKQTPENLYSTICLKSHERIYKCLENILIKAEPCLNLEEKYLPELLLTAHNATFKRQCGEGVENITEVVFAIKSTNCTLSFPELKVELFEKCLPKLDHVKALTSSAYVLKKADFCYDLEIAHNCVIEGIKLRCSDNEGFVEYIEKLFGYFLNPCRNDVAVDDEVTTVLFD